ncbi:MAG: DUF1080 domain-containing protein, partial [Planctomycetes bacterium]|nr:DUF1080 domain-containing protein [Planctomycetota bacterium]
MNHQRILTLIGAIVLCLMMGCVSVKVESEEMTDEMAEYQSQSERAEPIDRHIWGVHDVNRPPRPVVTPGPTNSSPPSDAVVLFDGTDLSNWQSVRNANPAQWKVENGYMEAAKGTGDIQTRQSFGDCQLHIEWATPTEVVGNSQGRGNSGVFLLNTYEVQVLDSYDNVSYPDGQAGAIYGQKPPLVNASRRPGLWQTYDIFFRGPKFSGDKLIQPATITVVHNGVLIQDHWTIEGETLFQQRARYTPHPDKLPIKLQDHGNPVRYRNIWI